MIFEHFLCLFLSDQSTLTHNVSCGGCFREFFADTHTPCTNAIVSTSALVLGSGRKWVCMHSLSIQNLLTFFSILSGETFSIALGEVWLIGDCSLDTLVSFLQELSPFAAGKFSTRQRSSTRFHSILHYLLGLGL